MYIIYFYTMTQMVVLESAFFGFGFRVQSLGRRA